MISGIVKVGDLVKLSPHGIAADLTSFGYLRDEHYVVVEIVRNYGSGSVGGGGDPIDIIKLSHKSKLIDAFRWSDHFEFVEGPW